MDSPVVVKIGGNAAVDLDRIVTDIHEMVDQGIPIVLIHGGSADIDSLADRLGVVNDDLVAPDGVTTRHTDADMLEVVVLALAGSVKPRLMARLAAEGVSAAGLTGLDDGLLQAKRKGAHRAIVDGRLTIVRDDHSGRVVDVHVDVINALLAAGIVPVISPPAIAEDGRPVNVDADRAAAAVAGALDAEALVLLTGAPGVLDDADDENSLLDTMEVSVAGTPPVVTGGMGTKLIAAREALQAGVGNVFVSDGRVDEPIQAALAGAGTEIFLESAEEKTP